MWLISFFLILGLIILIHESGHLIAAKLVGIKVDVFSIFFGRKIFSRKIGETEYKIGWIPLGGYIKQDEDSYNNASIPKRFFVLIAGVCGNFALAFALIWCLFFTGMPAFAPIIGDVLPNSPAERAGFLAGDTIIEISGIQIKSFDDMNAVISNSTSPKLDIIVVRGGNAVQLSVVPEKQVVKTLVGTEEEKKFIGVSLSGDAIKASYGIVESFTMSASYNYNLLRLNTIGVAQIIKGKLSAKDSLAGPIGIAHITKVMYESGFISLVKFAALLSLIVGFMNILPIPILDGGHIMFLGVEGIFGKDVSVRMQPVAQKIGMALLLSLIIFATYADIMRIFFG